MKITVKEKERGEDRTVEYELDELHITGNSAEEREVTVTASADEDVIHIYTSDDSYLTKFKKLMSANPKWKIIRVTHNSDGSVPGVMLEAPKNCLSFRAGLEREYTDEQRAAMRDRLRNIGK